VFADAKIKAKIEADEKARREIINAEARVLAAEREIIRVEEKAKVDIEQSALRAIHEAKLFQEKEERIKREQEQIKDQAKSTQANVDKVNQSIIDDFLAIGLNDKQAKYILDAILDNKIRAFKIEY